MLILIGFMTLIQLLGNATLVIGAVLLILNPWVFVVFRRLYVSTATVAREKRVDMVQRIYGISNLIGIALVMTWVFQADVMGKYLSVTQAITAVLSGLGNSIVTSILFCDIFFRMTLTNWKTEKEKRDDAAYGRYMDSLFTAIESVVRKPSDGSDTQEDDKPVIPPGSESPPKVPVSDISFVTELETTIETIEEVAVAVRVNDKTADEKMNAIEEGVMVSEEPTGTRPEYIDGAQEGSDDHSQDNHSA